MKATKVQVVRQRLLRNSKTTNPQRASKLLQIGPGPPGVGWLVALALGTRSQSLGLEVRSLMQGLNALRPRFSGRIVSDRLACYGTFRKRTAIDACGQYERLFCLLPSEGTYVLSTLKGVWAPDSCLCSVLPHTGALSSFE